MLFTPKTKKRLVKSAVTVGTIATTLGIPWVGFKIAYDRMPLSDPGKYIVNHLMLFKENSKRNIQNTPRTIWWSNKDLSINEHGHRTKRNYSITKPDNQYRVILFGGSTTYGAEVEPNETWSNQFQDRVSGEFPNEDILILNAGKIGGDSQDILNFYKGHQKIYEPNLAIVHTGKNNATRSLLGDHEGPLVVKVNVYPWGGHKILLNNSITGPLLRYPLALYYGQTSEAARITNIVKKEWKSRLGQEFLEKMATKYPERFYDELTEVIREMKSNKTDVVLFPVQVYPDKIKDFGEEFKRMHAILTDKNDQVMKRVADEQEIDIIKLSRENIPLEYFVDDCHLTKEGHKIKGDFVADYIIREGFIDKWIEKDRPNFQRKTQDPASSNSQGTDKSPNQNLIDKLSFNPEAQLRHINKGTRLDRDAILFKKANDSSVNSSGKRLTA